MRLHDRRCDVCGARADLQQTSAHFARVIWLCHEHGLAWRTSFAFFAACSEVKTATVSRLVDRWLARARADVLHTRLAAA